MEQHHLINQQKNIILIGFASTGKSTTGVLLAKRIGFSFLDLDTLIEERYAQTSGERVSVREVFARLGESGFCAIEAQSLGAIAAQEGIVLATGGRAPIPQENREVLRSMGTVIYLRAQLSIIRERMALKGVPLSIGGGSGDALEAEWKRRDSIYKLVAHTEIDSGVLNPEQTVDKIMDELHMHTAQ